MRSWSPHRWFVLALVVGLVVSLGVWWERQDILPSTLRVATAEEGGLYHRFGSRLGEELAELTGHRVEVVPTHGSLDNLALLKAGEVHLAILQATAVELDQVSVLAPLYREVVHVIVRSDAGVERLVDLVDKRVSVGLRGSGMRESSKRLLGHYRIGLDDIQDNETYFTDLEQGKCDAAIVTTGIDNPDLLRLMATGSYRLLPVLDGDAISMRQPLFTPFRIPRSLYHERPAVPPEALQTIATTAVLVAGEDCGNRLVVRALNALYSDRLRVEFPAMVPKREALTFAPAPLHARAQDYLDPYGGIDVLSQAIEAMSGAKELLFGLGALGYLIWDLVNSRRRAKGEREMISQRKRLDDYLRRTMAIERAQMDTVDVDELERFLDDVTELKLEALDELTHEDLRGNRMFLIYLTQCANLIRKIQTKILTARARERRGDELAMEQATEGDA